MQFYLKMLFALCYELIFMILLNFCVLISLHDMEVNSPGNLSSCYAFTTIGAQYIQLLRIVFSLQLDINVERFKLA